MLDSRPDTYAHILEVQRLLLRAISQLQRRLLQHDVSKLSGIERDAYDEYAEPLHNSVYDSDEAKALLAKMKPAIKHHYELNRHHPEHFPNGILDMSLIDLIELLCDWKAAGMRHPSNPDLHGSIEACQERFGYSDELKVILHNTVHDLEVYA
jgi:hypothetical protein